MRALWLDYADDKVKGINDQFMFGPALMIAPVVEQGQSERTVYLPAGNDWIDYHSNVQYPGGQTITVATPLDIIPIFVKAGSIIVKGEVKDSTKEEQENLYVHVYPGKDASFTLYEDDGKTYNYEEGEFQVTDITWDNATEELAIKEATSRLFDRKYQKIVEVVCEKGQ